MAGALALLILCAPPALALDDDEVGSLVLAALDLYNEQSGRALPVPRSEQFEDLLGREVVKVRRHEKTDEGESYQQVTGYLLVDQPRLYVWLAAMDPHVLSEPWFHSYRLDDDGRGDSTWYHHLDLPWPVTDRHYTVSIRKEVERTRATHGVVWEHSWDLAENGKERARAAVAAGKVEGVDLKTFDASVYLPRDFGGWVAMELADDVTLLAYFVSVDVGGLIPEGFISTVAMAQLDKLLHQVADFSATIPEHYRGDHVVMNDGLGEPVPTFSDAD
jgi:hypothetical protein